MIDLCDTCECQDLGCKSYCDALVINMPNGTYECFLKSTYSPPISVSVTITNKVAVIDYELNSGTIYNLFFKNLDICFTFKNL
jgi:hypothetical protein